jgi:hypothetical protein
MPDDRAAAREFVDREIVVEAGEDEPDRPKAFRLGKRRYEVAEVVSTWRDQELGAPTGFDRSWRDRHQRTYLRVKTAEGDLFDIFFDMAGRRKQGRRRWVLHRRLRGAEAPPAPPGAIPEEPPPPPES